MTGIAFGVVGFLIALGILDDWFLWTRGTEVPLRHGPPQGQPAWTRYFGVDYNHKVIGIQYGYTSVLVLLIGGLFALIFRPFRNLHLKAGPFLKTREAHIHAGKSLSD